jgi:hypothetical protein
MGTSLQALRNNMFGMPNAECDTLSPALYKISKL